MRQFRSVRRVCFGVALAMLAMLIGLFGATTTVSAMPSTVFGPPKEVSKVTLADTSIDGPALWTSSSGSVRAELAWTGTDAAHHLNVMTSSDGIHYSGKVILSDTSSLGPGVARYGADVSDNTVIAWIGTDRNRTLNVWDGVPLHGYTKLTLWGENSFTSPAIATTGGGDLYLVWAGTDSGHSLNIAHIIARGGMSLDWKVTLSKFHSPASPSLVYDPNTHQLLLSWITGDNHIHFAMSPDGKTWTEPAGSPIHQLSDVGPWMSGFDGNNMPRYFVTWRGTDAAHSVNVRYTESFPNWPLEGNQSTLDESSFGGPVVGYVGGARQTLIAWTGTDAAHHLNLAVIGV
ncbi:MAG TPA: sialidase family protein [Ktedonobacterales bacterium]|nr:sialidase family protein [Ktedonobacterales bacterium]